MRNEPTGASIYSPAGARLFEIFNCLIGTPMAQAGFCSSKHRGNQDGLPGILEAIVHNFHVGDRGLIVYETNRVSLT